MNGNTPPWENDPARVPLTRASEDAANAELEAVMAALNPDLWRLAKENTEAMRDDDAT